MGDPEEDGFLDDDAPGFYHLDQCVRSLSAVPICGPNGADETHFEPGTGDAEAPLVRRYHRLPGTVHEERDWDGVRVELSLHTPGSPEVRTDAVVAERAL